MPKIETVTLTEKDQIRIRQILTGFPFSASTSNRPSDVLHSEFSGDNLCKILNELSEIISDYTEKQRLESEMYRMQTADVEAMRRLLGTGAVK